MYSLREVIFILCRINVTRLFFRFLNLFHLMSDTIDELEKSVLECLA